MGDLEMYDYLIVGAGLFGSVFAHEATKRGAHCLVVEKRPHIGGNLYQENINGIDVHRYGAHIFHTSDKAIWDYVNQFVTFNNFVNSPIANYKGELYSLPFNMNTFYQLWGVKTPQEAQEKIREQSLDVEYPQNLEEQALKLVGSDIYEKLIKGYTEKQWQRDPKELPSFLIKRLPLRFTFDNNYFNDTYQGIPNEGYNTFISKLLEGSDVILNIDYFKHRERLEAMATTVVFTGPIDQFYNYKYGHLEYRTLHFETETVPIENYQGVAVMNFTDHEVPYTRVIEHKHFKTWSNGTQLGTVITKEYPREWEEDDEPYYPIDDDRNIDISLQYHIEALGEENVIFGGRLGDYTYYDMDDVIRKALEAIEDEFI